jgi:PEP-CTERM motif
VPDWGIIMNFKVGITALGSLLLAFAMVAHADPVTGTVGCATAANTAQHMDTSCNAPTGGSAMINTSGLYSSAGIDVTLTSISGLTTDNPVILGDLNPSAPQQWTFAFSGGDFTIKATNGDFSLAGTYTVSATGDDTVTLDLAPTNVTFVFDGMAYPISLVGKDDTGTATIDYTGDPIVTGVSVTTQFNTPTVPSPVPEPGTLGLLAAGLFGLATLGRRAVA